MNKPERYFKDKIAEKDLKELKVSIYISRLSYKNAWFAYTRTKSKRV